MDTNTIDRPPQAEGHEPATEPATNAPQGGGANAPQDASANAPANPSGTAPASTTAGTAAAPPAQASANQPPAEVNAQLDEFEQQVGAFEQTYSEKAEQKNGLQKGMDWTRSWVNRDAAGQGHGDDQFKNIANTQIEVGNIKRDLASGQATEQQAQARLQDLRQDFSTEADRVSQAQGRNAQAGKFVHQAGRVATVAAAGIGGTVASGGNVFVGGVAAVGAGNLYDAATVAAGQADKALGNGPKDGQPSAFAPQLDTKQSFVGLAANAATGEKITGQDVFNATTSTALDFVGGAGAGNGVKTARAAIAASSTTHQAVRATAEASVKNTLAQSGATYTVQAASAAANPWMTDEQKTQRMGQLTQDSLAQLPGQLAFGAASSAAGVAVQPASKLADIGTQLGVDALSNTGEAVTTNLIQGKGPGLTDEQWINAAVGSTTGALHNVMQRPPGQPHGSTDQPGSEPVTLDYTSRQVNGQWVAEPVDASLRTNTVYEPKPAGEPRHEIAASTVDGTRAPSPRPSPDEAAQAVTRQLDTNEDLQAAIAESMSPGAIERTNHAIKDMRARGEITASAVQPTGDAGASRQLPPELSAQERLDVGQVKDWPGYEPKPREAEKVQAAKPLYSSSLYEQSRATAQRIIDAQQTPGAPVPNIGAVWQDAARWRRGVADATMGEDAAASFGQRRDPGEAFTPMIGRWAYVAARVAEMDGVQVRKLGDLDPDPNRDANLNDTDIHEAVIAGRLTDGTSIELTRFTSPVDGLTPLEAKRIATTTKGMSIVHPDLQNNGPALQTQINESYRRAIDPSNKSFEQDAASMYWWLSHSMFDKRGSSSQADYALQTVYQVQGQNLPATKSGIVLNLEALTRTQSDFVEQFPKMLGAQGTPAWPARGPTTLFEPETKFDQRAQSTDGKTILVLPDTHGRDDLQQKAFDYLRNEQPWVFEGDGATVVSLGDTIDKGPNSAQNVDALIKRAGEEGVAEVITHMGNHEMWITEWLNRPGATKYAHDWIANRGGAIALRSYERFAQDNPELSNFSLEGLDLDRMPTTEVEGANGRKATVPDNSTGFYTELHQRMVDGLPKSHLEFYDNLQSSTRIGDYFFSHAGADPKRALDDQGLSALAWIRDPYLNHEGEWPGEPNTTTVSGHTILKQPLIQDNKFAIDLGTFQTGDFMTAILQNDLVRFAIFRKDAEPVFTDVRGGFEQGLFAPSFDPSLVIKNPKKK
jgi:serine/threonine protein phosphatase 1